MQKKFFCRWAPSLGELEDTALNVWGTPPYDPKVNSKDTVVFFGLYGLPDFYELWRHKGEKYVLWAGSDINHFVNGYWLDEQGNIRVCYEGFAFWLNKYCEHWVENYIEQEKLEKVGIKAKIVPSFLGDVTKYEVTYKHKNKPKLYTSVSGDNFELYGWEKIKDLAKRNPDVEFHLYGNTVPFFSSANVIEHGRIPKEQMNKEIKKMQGAIRLTECDGFSEILAKSILWGQWPVSKISYPHMYFPGEIWKIKEMMTPNLEGREYYLKILNNFPWNVQKYQTTF